MEGNGQGNKSRKEENENVRNRGRKGEWEGGRTEKEGKQESGGIKS